MRINSIGSLSLLGTKPQKNLERKENSPNFQKLLSVTNLEKFTPESSESAYVVMKTFNNDSWAIKRLLEKYDVKAFFTTKWFTTHPLYRKTHDYEEPIASYAQMDLFVKDPNVPEEPDGVMTDKVWQKISIGEYSNYAPGIRLSEAELKLAFAIKKIPYHFMLSLARPIDSDEVYFTQLNSWDYENIL